MKNYQQLKPYLNYFNFNTSQHRIVKCLIDNQWSTTQTCQQLHINSRKVTPLRRELRQKLPQLIWEENHDLTAADIAKMLKMSRRNVGRQLKQTDYDPKQHYQVSNRYRNQRREDLEILGQESMTANLNISNLDTYIESHRQNYSYLALKRSLYDFNPHLRELMYHHLAELSAARIAKLRSNNYARKVFIDASALDFPDYAEKQVQQLVYSALNLKVPVIITEDDRRQIIADYCRGIKTINQLAVEHKLTYKRVHRILCDANCINNRVKQRQQSLRSKIARQNLAKSSRQSASTKLKRAVKQATIPKSYFYSVPDWAQAFVRNIDADGWFSQLRKLFNDKTMTIDFLDLATQKLKHRVSIAELDLIFPPVNGIKDVSRLVYLNFGQDQDIKSHTNSQDSSYEERLAKLLHKWHIKFEQHNRQLISPRELDFYLPEQKLAIELSPIRTHNSNKYRHEFALGKTSTYHYTKYRHCAAQGIEPVTLFQKMLDEPAWTNLTVPFLKLKLTKQAEQVYYARQTKIRQIDKPLAKQFLTKYHFDGSVPARDAYGVFNADDDLLGVFTVTLPQNASQKKLGRLELKRLAWRSDVQVRFGLSKIVAFLKQTYADSFTGLLSFSDNNIGLGLSYQKAGFKFVKESGPQLTYINPRHPNDHYSWSIAIPWGAKSGVLAKAFGSQKISRQQAEKLIELDLPHRADNSKGYDVQYDTGNKVWAYEFN